MGGINSIFSFLFKKKLIEKEQAIEDKETIGDEEANEEAIVEILNKSEEEALTLKRGE